ncbi:ABC transporter permease [Microbacterium sp. Au-Mic1]|uniref:ABC transporter permease n=1 Tax=Microbacterium sp. Au-Mic1 TaxID=2906457 RepID=UPI001E60DE69|nr:ABC transporter permease [Microbacterium sp. Au-Mic1]MCE4025783.1 ABC transporter permease [Microbacterium sp. Au-Mic1]
MLRYALTRGALLIAGLLVASALIFLALRVFPGDVAQLLAGDKATPAQVDAIRTALGLDQPLVLQYLGWIGGVLHGDLGTSQLNGASVAAELTQKAQVTVPLATLSLLVALIIAVPLGIGSALLRGRAAGTALNTAAQAVAAVPVVWAGMMLVVVFAVWLRWLPAQGFPRGGWADPGAALQALILPALTIGAIEGALLLRFVRSATLQAASQDFVRTAAAKGLTRNRALLQHGLPAVGLSIITVLGIQVAGIIVGSVVVEQLFTLPGIGRMLVADVGTRDLVKVQGELLVLTGMVLIIGFVVDLVHRALDPRQREADE